MRTRLAITVGCLFSLGLPTNVGLAAPAPAPTEAQKPAQANTAEPAPGWEKFEGGGVSVNLPEAFEGGSLETFDTVVSTLRSLGPSYESLAQTIEANQQAFVLFAYDPKITGAGGPTNVVVAKEAAPEAVSLDTYLQSTVSAVSRLLPDSAISSSILSLNGQRVGRIVADHSLNGNQIKQVTYIFRDSGIFIVAAYTTSLEEFDARLPAFEQSASTLRF